jgi:signal transduction histidine kinase
VKSIRRSLLLILGPGLLLLLLIAGVALYYIVKARTYEAFDDGLRTVAQTLATGLELDIDPERRAEAERLGAGALGEDEGARERLLELAREAFRVRFSMDVKSLPEFQQGPESSAYQIIGWVDGAPDRPEARMGIWRADGPEEDAGGIPVFGVPLPFDDFREHALPDGRPGRWMTLAVKDVGFREPRWQRAWEQISGGPDAPRFFANVNVGRDVTKRDAFLGTLRGALFLAGALLLVLAGLLTGWAVRRGLTPLARLSADVESLDPRALDTRLDGAHLPAELGPMVQSLNDALGRIEQSMAREKRTTADIAHELRTPLAELGSVLDVAQRWPDDVALQKSSVEESRQVVAHMSRVVSALLKLARTRSGAEKLETTEVPVSELVRALASQIGEDASRRKLTVDVEVTPDLVVETNAEVFETIVGNLVRNAVQHAPEGSQIQVSLAPMGPRARFQVRNAAPGLSEADLPRLTDPFWRAQESRVRTELAGLGLAVAAELAEAAGHPLTFELQGGALIAGMELNRRS